MLHKKDYKTIAGIIKAEKDYADIFAGKSFAMCRIINIAKKLADYLETTNPRFDREKFLKACGL